MARKRQHHLTCLSHPTGALGDGACGIEHLHARVAVAFEYGVGLASHQLEQDLGLADVDRLTCSVCLGVGRAVPVQVVTAWPPAGALVFLNGDEELLVAVRLFDPRVVAANRQLPAHIGFGLGDADVESRCLVVQRATSATGKTIGVQKDAAIMDDASLALAFVVLLDPVLVTDLVVFPRFGGKPFDVFFDALLVGLLTKVRAIGAAAVLREALLDALAAAAPDAVPVRGQPREIAPVYLLGI